MYWSEDYGDDKIYYYSGSLNEDGTFKGHYNYITDAAELNKDINADVKFSGDVTISDIVCTVD